MPILIELTLFMSGDPIMVNVSKIQTISPMKESNGCTITFDDSRKIAVKGSMTDIWYMVRDFIVST